MIAILLYESHGMGGRYIYILQNSCIFISGEESDSTDIDYACTTCNYFIEDAIGFIQIWGIIEF